MNSFSFERINTTIMIQSFKYQAPSEILFGIGELKQLPQLVARFGKRILLITGNTSFEKLDSVKVVVNEIKRNFILLQAKIANEPSPEQIDEIVRQNKSNLPNVVVAIGGGSVIDGGKAISAMLKADYPIENYLEGIGNKQPSGDKVPFIAIPTTAGTGSECTKNAVITKVGKSGFKKSLRHDEYLPNIAIVDPELTMSCSKMQTAASGLDATTQLLEAFLSGKCNGILETLVLDGLRRILLNIESAVEVGNIEARSEVSYAAMLSGIALANAGLGLVHGFAQPLGSLIGIPHGIVCANLMGIVNKFTVHKLRESNDTISLSRYKTVARFVFPNNDEDKSIDLFIEWLIKLPVKFGLPTFSAFNLTENDFDLILEKTDHKNHPVLFTNSELKQVLSFVL